MLTGIFENGASVVQKDRTTNSVEVHQNRAGKFEVKNGAQVLMTREVIEEANEEARFISIGLATGTMQIQDGKVYAV